MLSETGPKWDYLIVTASNDLQARAYAGQLALRQTAGLLPGVRQSMVVADPEGRRVGSGGSTLFCLIEVLQREAAGRGADLRGEGVIEGILRELRILIIHAGGDSRRLPAYGPCGKIFVPVPGARTGPVWPSLFDREFSGLASLPCPGPGRGQVVVTSGDALILFDPKEVQFADTGVTALGNLASAQAASKHGVFCVEPDGSARLYLQKPKEADQARHGALDRDGQAVLDIGIMSFDGRTAAALLEAFELKAGDGHKLNFSARFHEAIMNRGLDIYREVLCALGKAATEAHHLEQARSAGSSWEPALLRAIFHRLHPIPLHAPVLSRCTFLHFGTTRQLIESGQALTALDTGAPPPNGQLLLNNRVHQGGLVDGPHCWVEGCQIASPLRLGGSNVLVGVDVMRPLNLAAGQCLDIVPGHSRQGKPVFFARPHAVTDTFKDPAATKGTFCGIPMRQWIEAAGVRPDDIWDASVPTDQRSLWDARVFPATASSEAYVDWLWMFDPQGATAAQREAFRAADRYSSAEIALLANQEAFYARRRQ